MNLVCRSIFALLAFYILYSECIKLPEIVKKNKTLFYFLIGGLYLYMYQNDQVEGISGNQLINTVFFVFVAFLLSIGVSIVSRIAEREAGGEEGDNLAPVVLICLGLIAQAVSLGLDLFGWMPLIVFFYGAFLVGVAMGKKDDLGAKLGVATLAACGFSIFGWPGGYKAFFAFPSSLLKKIHNLNIHRV